MRPPRARARYDVVFYTPWTGPIMSLRNPRPVGGIETQVLLLTGELARLGLRVALVAYGEADDLPAQRDGVDILRRPPYGPRGITGRMRETLWVFRALWRAPGAPVVYEGAAFELGLIGLYARAARRRLIFYSANVTDFEVRRVYPNRLAALLYKMGMRLSDPLIVQTEEQVEMCRRTFGRVPGVIRYIAEVSPAPAEPPEAFLWVGRLVEHKRPLAYLDLAEALPEARFWMIGVPPDNPAERSVSDRVSARAGDIPNLEFLGPRPNAEVLDFMRRAVASVNTADHEGMPNVLLEGWAQGAPALVLTHDPDGLIGRFGLGGFAAGSWERFVEVAREQWESRTDPARREDVSRRCQQYVAREHAPEVIARQWAEVLGGLR